MIEMNCPLPHTDTNTIQLSHGGGGKMTHQLISSVFYPAFSNPLLNDQHDGAVFECDGARLAYTTDSFVVDPLFFHGGNIGDLAVNGTVNDLTCCGAKPLFLTAAFIIEEGFDMGKLRQIVESMRLAAQKAGVSIVTGDTKVVDKGKCDKIFINTSGIGLVPAGLRIHPDQIQPGDAVILSGPIGEHGVCILSSRESLGFETTVASDTASLNEMIGALLEEVPVHVLRDPTRGGVSSTLNEIAEASGTRIILEEEDLPVSGDVLSACDLLGIDPLYVANEGVMIIIVRESDVMKTLDILHRFPEGKNAVRVGTVSERIAGGEVLLHTYLGGNRIVEMLSGEQLPRIC
ncbi:MAG: hydrogenase expression/formation protein HypE [Bacteroidales bacterium]